jgi:hypothetical protein
MYRLLREAEQVRERRAQATPPARKKPELIAGAPSELRSWDITKLAGPLRGMYYHLYVMIDISPAAPCISRCTQPTRLSQFWGLPDPGVGQSRPCPSGWRVSELI